MNLRVPFSQILFEEMKKNKNIYIVTGDLGYGYFDKAKEKFPKQYINVGAAEQSMIGIGVGLALEGKIPIVYSITPFLLYRPFETIRNYLNYERIPVKLIGSGRDKDYMHDGFSHWSEEDKQVMSIFPNIHSHWPKTENELNKIFHKMINHEEPYYINLSK